MPLGMVTMAPPVGSPSSVLPPVVSLDYVPWGRRFAARVIDTLVLLLITALTAVAAFIAGCAIGGTSVGIVAGFLSMILDVFSPLAYHVVGGSIGQTCGRRVMGYRIARLDGSPLGLPRSFSRELLVLVSTVPAMIGWLAPLWAPRRQTWHDSLVGAVAIESQPMGSGRVALIWAMFFSSLTAAAAVVLATI